MGRRVWYAPGRLVAAGFSACLSADFGLLRCVAALCLQGARHPQTCTSGPYSPAVTSLARAPLLGRLAGLGACIRLLDATAFVGSRLWAADQRHSTCLQGYCHAACSLISTPPLGPRNCWSKFWGVAYMPSGRWEYKALSRPCTVTVAPLSRHCCGLLKNQSACRPSHLGLEPGLDRLNSIVPVCHQKYVQNCKAQQQANIAGLQATHMLCSFCGISSNVQR